MHYESVAVPHRIESRTFVVVLDDREAALDWVELGRVRDVKDVLYVELSHRSSGLARLVN